MARCPATAKHHEHSTLRHLATFLHAMQASIGTSLAVVRLVFCAFFSACLAYRRAKGAQLTRKATIPRHPCRCEAANVRTVAIEPNTIGHRRTVALAQTGSRAVLTRGRASVAGLDTRSKVFMGHRQSPYGDPSNMQTLCHPSNHRSVATPRCRRDTRRRIRAHFQPRRRRHLLRARMS